MNGGRNEMASCHAQWCSILARHNASKVSEAVVSQACESRGSLGFSATAFASSLPECGCAEVCAGHSSDDFESMGLPSYQHFRPSMRRQDQYPFWFDGIAALHCCFVCPAGIETNEIAVTQAAKTVWGECLVIAKRSGTGSLLAVCCDDQIGAVADFHPLVPHVWCGAGARGIPQV